MAAPLIGLTVSRISRSHQRKASLLLIEYTEAVRAAGGCPVLIPNEYPLQQLEHLRGLLNGILITGGGDINPHLYQAEDDGNAKNIVKERDSVEKALVELAVKTDWPLLGICRGQQMLNAALGGTLFTDISRQYNTKITHSQPDDVEPGRLVHHVEIQPSSLLINILSKNEVMVNSRHHQAVKEVAPGLQVTARASDGLIEGIEHPGLRFCLGVQWHPESLQTLEEQRAIFGAFINAAS
ncbi:MAG TPA: gamma-glutamyl-gamma-aminobutyrate hydrolase family protein [Anaerolineaceae bacterium]|nr:gamma-glutamyl-gamma-aminobutyrate hydrolase family protein [Anaerolineaceae bacterium]